MPDMTSDNSPNLFTYLVIRPFMLLPETSVPFLYKDMRVLENKIFLEGVTVFLPSDEAYLARIARKLSRPPYKRSKIVCEISSPDDFFHILFHNAFLRWWLLEALVAKLTQCVLHMMSVDHSSKVSRAIHQQELQDNMIQDFISIFASICSAHYTHQPHCWRHPLWQRGMGWVMQLYVSVPGLWPFSSCPPLQTEQEMHLSAAKTRKLHF